MYVLMNLMHLIKHKLGTSKIIYLIQWTKHCNPGKTETAFKIPLDTMTLDGCQHKISPWISQRDEDI